MAVNIWDGKQYVGKYIGDNGVTLYETSATRYTVTPLTVGHEYTVNLVGPTERFRCATFKNDPSISNEDGIRFLYGAVTPLVGETFTFTAEENENYLFCYIGHTGYTENAVIEVWDMNAFTYDEKYAVTSERLIEFADTARKIVGSTNTMTPEEMSTAFGNVQTLIDTANAKTGGGDTDLTSAVGTLVEGYGGNNLDTTPTLKIKAVGTYPNVVKGYVSVLISSIQLSVSATRTEV